MKLQLRGGTSSTLPVIITFFVNHCNICKANVTFNSKKSFNFFEVRVVQYNGESSVCYRLRESVSTILRLLCCHVHFWKVLYSNLSKDMLFVRSNGMAMIVLHGNGLPCLLLHMNKYSPFNRRSRLYSSLTFFIGTCTWQLLNMLNIKRDINQQNLKKKLTLILSILFSIFTHLKLWVASARHNFKWVKIPIE